MTLEDALRILRSKGSMADLGEAISVVLSSPQATLFDIALGLKHPGVIAEQAAFALYKRSGRELPADLASLNISISDWVEWILNHQPQVTPFMAKEKPEKDQNHQLVRRQLADLITTNLNPIERLVLVFRYYEEMTYEEIAAVLNIKQHEVRTLHQQLLSRLREQLLSDAKALKQLLCDIAA